MGFRRFLALLIVAAIVIGTTYFLMNYKNVTPEVEPTNNEEEQTIDNVDTLIELLDNPVLHDTEYGGVFVDISIEEFNRLGFSFGDSINFEFSNGFKMEDVPYYNGYYVAAGEMLLVGYPGYEHIRLGYNYGDDLWVTANVTEDTLCSIYLNEAAKYLDMQKMRDITYTDEQGDLPDEVFANFRPMNVGNLKENTVYRGASPIDNKHNRAPITDRLLSLNGIQYVINLADSDEEIAEFRAKEDFNSPYFISLYDNGKVSRLDMNIQYKSDEFSQKLAQGLRDMANSDGPYYIHCQEGKDRTGYVCMVVEGLAGASYDEIINDYMKTYENYYDITTEKDSEKYELIKKMNIDDMLLYVTGLNDVEELKTANIESLMEQYLIRCGMTTEEIDLLRTRIVQ